jgi:hypothetical protein
MIAVSTYCPSILHATPRHTSPHHTTPRHTTTQYHATPQHHATLHHVTPRHHHHQNKLWLKRNRNGWYTYLSSLFAFPLPMPVEQRTSHSTPQRIAPKCIAPQCVIQFIFNPLCVASKCTSTNPPPLTHLPTPSISPSFFLFSLERSNCDRVQCERCRRWRKLPSGRTTW